MANRFEIEEKLGLTLGEKGSDRKATHAAFVEKGLISLNPNTISRLKAGQISGEKTNNRLDISRLLELDDASSKNRYYQSIAETGIEVRTYNIAPQRAHILKADHFTNDIATSIQVNDQVVRKAIRAMRTDMVLSQIAEPQEQIANLFCTVAEGYLYTHRSTPPSMRSTAVIEIDTRWDHKNIASFYSSIYAVAGGRAIGS